MLGRNHLTTLSVANDLGVVYYSKGDLSMCSRLYQRVLLGREKALGVNNVKTLDTENNLAAVYRKMGEWGQAKKKYMRVQEGYLKAKGKDSSDYAMSVSNVGECLVRLGDIDEVRAPKKRWLSPLLFFNPQLFIAGHCNVGEGPRATARKPHPRGPFRAAHDAQAVIRPVQVRQVRGRSGLREEGHDGA